MYFQGIAKLMVLSNRKLEAIKYLLELLIFCNETKCEDDVTEYGIYKTIRTYLV